MLKEALRTCPSSHSVRRWLGFVNALEHDPEKCAAVFRKDHAQTKELKRDDNATQSRRALAQRSAAWLRPAGLPFQELAIERLFVRTERTRMRAECARRGGD